MSITQKQHGYITRFLQVRYTITSLYEREGVKHPALFFAADETQRDNPDSVVGNISEVYINPETFAFYNYAFLHDLQNSKRHLFNGTTFAMTRLKLKPLTIEAKLGKYFDTLATCHALEHELIAASTKIAIRVPMRHQYHLSTLADESITLGTGRSAAIGGATLIVFNDAGTYRALLNVRKGSQATRPQAIHVLPAFMFQPMHNVVRTQDKSITHAIYRELLEELFGMPDGTDPEGHPALDDLQQMQARGDATLQLLGITMNLLTLRPEIISLLLIHDATWWQRIHDDVGVQLSESDELLIPVITDDEQLFSALPENVHLRMPPQAYVTLREGVDLARQLIAAHTK